MITVRCPVRVSLIGGSSDLPAYLDKHGRGSVISFTPRLYTYVSVYSDLLGRNKLDNKYIVNYSKREEVCNVSDIENDLVRNYFRKRNIPPCSVHMTSDIFSHGSGLAVSSSYSCSLVHAIEEMYGRGLTNVECGIRAHNLEKTFNPLLGLQDVYGCCVGGFKKIVFEKDKLPQYTFLPTQLFDLYDAYLVFTGITRSSTEVLKTVKVPDTDILNPLVEKGEQALMVGDYYRFFNIINEGWEAKKRSSNLITENENIKKLDKQITMLEGYKAHKLCGAGNGGFFLCFLNMGVEPPENFFKLHLSNSGVERVL